MIEAKDVVGLKPQSEWEEEEVEAERTQKNIGKMCVQKERINPKKLVVMGRYA